jgi:NhaA family Na+:H+ antiporter
VPDTNLHPTGDESNQTVTLSINHQVRPDREADFEQFLHEFDDAASRFPGYLGVRVFRPRRGNNDYRILLRFDRASDLRLWMESEEREIWRARGEELAEAPARITNITGTAQERPLALALSPLQSFVSANVSGIGLLLLGTVIALVMANSPLSDTYERLWATELTIGIGDYGITDSLRHWVNDCLMALFFFIVGLEIKREVLVGELRYPRQAALPFAAAIGGAAVPALLYLVLNLNSGAAHGWGVPIGTDTAFSLGIISLFAGRVRTPLLVFLTAFAIIDDIVAVLMIAFFYTDELSWSALGVAAVLLAALAVANRAGFRHWPVYAVLGIGVWLAVFESGVHGTLAGVLVAMMIPTRAWINPREFLARARYVLDEFETASYQPGNMLTNEHQQEATQALERLTGAVEAPLSHFEHGLSPWVTYFVVPLFAFANAGIPIVDGFADALSSPVTWGVILGLIVGKPLGITFLSWLAVRSGIARLPSGIDWRDVFGVAWLGGIGFTMSLFITELAFAGEETADAARIGVLIGSLVAGVVGYFILRSALPSQIDIDEEIEAEAA